MSRSLVPLNDWQWAQLTLLLLTLPICLWPTSLLIVILFMFIICFHPFLPFILIPMIQSFLSVNLIPMLTLAHLAATLFLFLTLAESVMSPPTTPNKVFVKRMCQLSLVQQLILVKPVVKLLFLSSMRACGLVPGFHTHSSIRINSDTMASLCKTTPSIGINPFPSNTLSLQSHSRLWELLSFLTVIHLPSMSLILAPTYT